MSCIRKSKAREVLNILQTNIENIEMKNVLFSFV